MLLAIHSLSLSLLHAHLSLQLKYSSPSSKVSELPQSVSNSFHIVPHDLLPNANSTKLLGSAKQKNSGATGANQPDRTVSCSCCQVFSSSRPHCPQLAPRPDCPSTSSSTTSCTCLACTGDSHPDRSTRWCSCMLHTSSRSTVVTCSARSGDGTVRHLSCRCCPSSMDRSTIDLGECQRLVSRWVSFLFPLISWSLFVGFDLTVVRCRTVVNQLLSFWKANEPNQFPP